MNRYFRRCCGLAVSTTTVVMLGTFTASSQQKAKLAPEKWRPKDGLYIRTETKFTDSCEYAAEFLLELDKKHFAVDERWGCKITKITDAAPDTLRLTMTCNESEIAGDDDGKDYTETMVLRKIGGTSFNMQLTNKGKFNGPPWRVNYCEQVRE